MIDLRKQVVDINCPACNFQNQITLKQAQIRSIIICRGCKSNIQLQDYFNTVRKALKSIRRELKGLEKAIENFGNITINL
jgi:transposase-like protein